MPFLKKIFLSSFLITSLIINSQEINRPKIGLCLSGGGAKGLAHIGLLKLIDSLGIKIDYITANSMGSVVGGLYAAGYTGKQIDSIAHTIDWDLLLNQYIPMNEIYADEKEEYGKYIGEIPIKKGRMQLTGFIEGQELLNLLMRLTQHVNQITDFNKLPIPFKCMAVDIVNVKPIILDHGSLAMSMRASMSIPTVFKPVKIDSLLLVDGGLMVNFPVHQLKNMGADFIIGSYTGGRLMDANEMNTIDKLLIQSNSFYGISKAKDDIALCDIFNSLTDSMKQYSAGDFKKSNRIIEAGNVIALTILPQLVKLADNQKASGVVYKKPNLIQSKRFYKVNDIIIEPTCDAKMTKFITQRITFKAGDSISTEDLEKTVKKIYGTRNFFKVYYILEPQPNGSYIVKLKIEQDVKFRFKGALHFDTELGSGFIFNLTARNWLGKGSRLFASVDLAESPKFRIDYKKYIAQSDLSFNTCFLVEKSPLQFVDPKGQISATESYIDLYRRFNVGLNYNIAIPASIYIGVIGEITRLSPQFPANINPPNEHKGDRIDVQKNITSHTSGLLGQFKFNTFNRFVFPSKGMEIFVENKLVLIPLDGNAGSTITIDSTYNTTTYQLNRHEVQYSQATLSKPCDRLFIKGTNLLPVTSRISLLSSFNMGFIYLNVMTFDTSLFHLKYTQYSYEGGTLNDMFFVGGVQQRSRPNFIPLWGVKDGNLTANNFVSLRLGMQCEVLHKLFITPALDYYYTSSSSSSSSYSIYDSNTSTSVSGSTSLNTSSNPVVFFKNILNTNLFKDGYTHFSNTSNVASASFSSTSPAPKGNYSDYSSNSYITTDGTSTYVTTSSSAYSSSAILTYGINIGYKSPIGPINFNVSKNSADTYWRVYFSVGYRF